MAVEACKREALAGRLGAFLGQRGVVDHQARGFDARLHVGQLEGDALELADLLPEGFAFTRVFERGFVGGLGDPQRLRADADAPHIQHGHGDLEALAFFAETVLDRDAAIFEQDFAGGRGADAQLGLLLAAAVAGRVRRDDEGGDALLLFLGIGHHENHDVIGHRTARDPGLASVQDVMIAIPDRAGAHRARVRA